MSEQPVTIESLRRDIYAAGRRAVREANAKLEDHAKAAAFRDQRDQRRARELEAEDED